MLSVHTSRVVLMATALVAVLSSSALAVDGVILIDQSRALAGNVTPGDAPGFPVTISRAGSYRLSGNLEVSSAADAVQITADRVTLDLNGFTIRNTDTASFNFGIVSSRDYVIVTDGIITEFATAVAVVGFGARVERIQAVHNSSFGIVAGPSSIVRANTARGNHIGIEVRGKSVIADNIVTDNENFGMTASGQSNIPGGSTITNNTVSSNGNIGLQVVCPSVLIGNVAVHNTSQNLMLINPASCLNTNNLAP